MLVKLEDCLALLNKAGHSEVAKVLNETFGSNPAAATTAKLENGSAPSVEKEQTPAEKPPSRRPSTRLDSYVVGANSILRKPDGTVYHLGVKEGDVCSRILTVGSLSRAEMLAELLDKDTGNYREFRSERNMNVFSGTYKGTEVSVISIGMGAPMADFFMREVSAVCSGPLAIVRLGTCGISAAGASPGTLMIASKGSSYVYRNYVHWDGQWPMTAGKEATPSGATEDPYLITLPVPCSAELSDALAKCAKEVGVSSVYKGLNACGESFYSCQGREEADFEDRNTWMNARLDDLGVDFIEMESHQIFHLAKCRKMPTYTAACAIGLVHRRTGTANVTAEMLKEMERTAGKACLEALVQFKMDA